jgi:uncharacterized membrane protein YecN with MAPEG domain
MILPITLTIAGAAAILNIWLAMRVGRLRRALKVNVGDGGDERVLRRMRAHANFAENMPIALILIALIELATGGGLLLWGAGILFVLARIAHPFGMDRPGANAPRGIGIVLTLIVQLGLGLWAILIAYQSPSLHRGIQIGPAPTVPARH